jgi:1,4-alpha-glucan branching enzyme
MKSSKRHTEKRRVTFKVRAAAAKEVIVVGDFNNWNAHEHPMKKDDEGIWKVTVLLAPGRYEYKLLIDGRWWEDIRGVNSTPNSFGTLNKLLFVPEK